MKNVQGVILAAGQGTRMKSERLKVLHPIMGVPMVDLVVRALQGAGVAQPTVVIGYQGERVQEALGETVDYVIQREQRGTGHAVSVAADHFSDYEHVVILYGDTPLVTDDLLSHLIQEHRAGSAAATLLTAVVEDPSGLGRIIRDDQGALVSVVEDSDASHAEAAIREINTAIACFQVQPLLECLPELRPDNAQGEYYLPDVFPLLLERGLSVQTLRVSDPQMVLGVNTRQALAEVTAVLRHRILDRVMESGVTIMDPTTTWIGPDVSIGSDTVIAPFTQLEGRSSVGTRCYIGPMTHLVNARLGEDVTVWHSVVQDSVLGDGVTVGPYAHLRPGNVIEAGVKIGNFVEIKNARVGARSKIPHHSYIGDAEIGSSVNVGAGVITVNYDGWSKHMTHIGDGAFIGCNSNLLAPVEIGAEAFVGAGSTITDDVPGGSLGIARSKQRNIDEWVRRRKTMGNTQDGKDEHGDQ